jgi:predicted Rossmann-fold nucleotide-binding protein
MKLGIFVGTDGRSELCESIGYMGSDIAKAGHSIICCNNSTGLSKALIDGTLSAGGNVELIDKDKKHLIKEYCDALIFLPGGFDVLASLCTILHEHQQGIYNNKPIAIYNIVGCYSNLYMQFMLFNKMGIDCKADFIYSRDLVHILDRLSTLIEVEEISLDDIILDDVNAS